MGSWPLAGWTTPSELAKYARTTRADARVSPDRSKNSNHQPRSGRSCILGRWLLASQGTSPFAGWRACARLQVSHVFAYTAAEDVFNSSGKYAVCCRTNFTVLCAPCTTCLQQYVRTSGKGVVATPLYLCSLSPRCSPSRTRRYPANSQSIATCCMQQTQPVC